LAHFSYSYSDEQPRAQHPEPSISVPNFTHIDSSNAPAMVDVGAKGVTHRSATAQAHVRFPAAVAQALRANGFNSAKGPVFHTAIIAGTMAAKRTHELIPFCHPLGIEKCDFTIEMEGDAAIIHCTVSVHHKTGVEMEALTGASIAALTIYDMCKALSHEIVISETKLMSKSGGRSGDFAVNSGRRSP
jgi:cyclic pyranopterin phosphate synthase